MKKRRLITLLGSICLILVLASLPLMGACAKPAPAPAPTPAPAPAPAPSPAPAPAPPKVIELKFANYFPPVAKQSIMLEEFCREVEKRTNERVKITYYPGGALLPAPTMFEGIVTAVADIGYCGIAYTPGRFPALEVCDLPLGFPSGWVGTHCVNDFYQQFKPKEWDEVHVLWMNTTGPSVILSKKPVRKLEDLKGLAFRAVGRQIDNLEALGGTAAPTPMTEVYDAIARGVLDGAYTIPECLKTWRFAEVVDYATLSWQSGFTAAFYVVMNKDSWNKLPPDIQVIFGEVCGEYKETFALMWNVIDLEGKEFAIEQGVELIELSPTEMARWVKAVEPVTESFVKELVGKGFSEAEVRGWLEFLRERTDYWTEKQIEYGVPSLWEMRP